MSKKSLSIILCFALVICLACSYPKREYIQEKTIDSSTLTNVTKSPSVYVQLHSHSLSGDFDGDGQIDTLFQKTIDNTTSLSIDSFPETQWDSMEHFFSTHHADVILTLHNRQCDTLHLGQGGGLFCLINIGDNNHDQKDEIALAVDYYDFTNITSCYIYTICGNHWKVLKSFKIHESAFDFDGDSKPPFKQIKGFLEWRKNEWFYIDYQDWFNAETSQDTMLRPLAIKTGCN